MFVFTHSCQIFIAFLPYLHNPRIWAEQGEMLRISPYPVRMRENVEKNHSEYGHILRSDCIKGDREGQKL